MIIIIGTLFRVCWEKLLEHAKCFVLSVCSNDKMDAYVLRLIIIIITIMTWYEILYNTVYIKVSTVSESVNYTVRNAISKLLSITWMVL